MSKLAMVIAIGALLVAGPALAAKTKDCGTTIIPETDVVKPHGGFTQETTTTTTTTQTSSCHSSSDTGLDTDITIVTGPVTNKGGGTPGGHQ